jgi:hypothetical protein
MEASTPQPLRRVSHIAQDFIFYARSRAGPGVVVSICSENETNSTPSTRKVSSARSRWLTDRANRSNFQTTTASNQIFRPTPPGGERPRGVPSPSCERGLKPQAHNEISSNGNSMENVSTSEHFRAAKSPKERLDEILGGYAGFVERYDAGDPETVAAVAAVGSPEERARAKEAYVHAIKVWREYRE